MAAAGPQSLRFADDGRVPNHPTLAVLVYHGVADVAAGAAACERLFRGHGWGGTWRNGIFPFQHYHSRSHEALGIVAGTATVLLGGEAGATLEVGPGDALVLPAGTGHRNLGSSPDLLVVGAYPPGQEDVDVLRDEVAEHDAAVERILKVSLPPADPVLGRHGGLSQLWH
jgi:uncharacterized protein YjlB